jgi:hypothetical protein
VKGSVEIGLNLQDYQRQSLIGQRDGHSRRFIASKWPTQGTSCPFLLMKFGFLSCSNRVQRIYFHDKLKKLG